MNNVLTATVLRSIAAVLIGAVIGGERARHGRAAGIRTHVLVCLGACMTSMTSMFVSDITGNNGDVFRISAQVVSGIGFLGAGMIILKSNNMISGLTTAAGVWTTATVGVALGYGYYIGAAAVTVLFLSTTVLFARIERKRKSTETVYIEVNDAYKVNEVLKKLESKLPESFTYHISAPKSGTVGNVGISVVTDRMINTDIGSLTEIENVVFAVEE